MIFKPAIWVLNGAGNGLLRLIGVKPASGHELVHSVEELKMLVTASSEGGVVEPQEREMLHAVFDFGDLLVGQVMIPRTEIIAVEADIPLKQIIALITESTYTKFPVYDDNLDNILGIVHVKDVLRLMQEPGWEESTARALVREPIYVPETIPVSALLRHFQDRRQHIAIVLDEYGGTAGLVTLEDLLEEIFGEVSDPFDRVSPEFQTQPDGSIWIDGMTLIEDVNAHLGLDLEDPNYYTIAGYVLGKLGRIPKVKESIEGDNVRLQVEALDGLRIARVSLTRLDQEPPG
jgi:CBS domain containing-hemolysin-like protein